jgi:F420-dependent oxidoreductase-like protein
MRVGLFIDSGGAPLQVVDQIVQAEADGFEAVYLSQIFGCDALTIIALAGQRTSRIELGTAVVPVQIRHPFAFAQECLTTNVAAGGRFALGIGLSHHVVVENMWGMSYERPAAYMREYLSVLQPLLSGQPASFSGEHFRVNGGVNVPGATPPKVMLAALAPVMLKMAGARTDGTVLWMSGAKAIESHIAPRINKAAREAGRPAPRIVCALPTAVTDDEAAGRARVKQLFAVYGQLPNYQRVLARGGAEGPADVAIVGDERAVEQQVRALASAGATDFEAAIFPVGDDAGASMARTRALVQSLVGKV